MDSDIDAFGGDLGIDSQLHRSEVQYCADASVGECAASLLGGFGRHRQQGDFGAGLGDDGRDLGDVVDADGADPAANLASIRIEGGDDAEGAWILFEISRQGAAEPAYTHHRDTMFLVQSHDGSQASDELLDLVPDSADSEFAELSQIFADKCGREIELAGQRLGGDALDARSLQLSKAPQVE